MKLVKTILIFPFYVCCLDKYYSSESLCEDCFCCCKDENENIVEEENSEITENKQKEEIKEEDEINFETISLNYENLGENLDNDKILAIKTYIFLKLNKSEQYSISSIDNCEGSKYKCKKITLNNSKNEEFILFIKGDKDPTFVFESLKAIGMSEIDYVYYNGYLVTSKVDGDVYKNGYDFDFSDLENLNVYRFFCSLFGCSDCEPFLRIDNVYIKNNEVFLLDYSSCIFSPIKTIEKFLDKLTYNTKIIPDAIRVCNDISLERYKEEEEQAFWVSIKVILCRDDCSEMDYYDKTLNDGKEIKITYFLSFLKNYIKAFLKNYIKEKNPTNEEENQIFYKLKEEMCKNTFTNDFINFLKGQKEILSQKLENAKKKNDENQIAVFEKKINDATSILKKIEEGEKVENLYNEELTWGRKIVKHMKNLCDPNNQKKEKLKRSYEISEQEKEKINKKLSQLINFYQSDEGKELIEKHQNNFKIVVSYLNNLINMPTFIPYIENDILNIIRNFVYNNSKYIIEKKSLF